MASDIDPLPAKFQNRSVEFVFRLAAELADKPSVGRLKELRSTLSDRTFSAALIRELKSINDLAGFDEIVKQMRDLVFLRNDRVENEKFWTNLLVRIAIVGGVTLVGASIVAMISAAQPLLLFFPILGGGAIIGNGSLGTDRTNDERVVFGDLHGIMDRITKQVQP